MKNKKTKKNVKQIVTMLFVFVTIWLLTTCSSVFSAGVSGKVVDAESTNNPKNGIAHVSVFVYTDESIRNKDFSSWKKGKRFSPTTEKQFIGQTSTNNSGEFTINKIVWESLCPEFGKTADFTHVFLLFYHENYGLVKNTNNVVIISGSTSNVIYQEMTSIRKATSLEIEIRNASSNNLLTTPINVRVDVPQIIGSTEYEVSITGSSSITVTYPRYKEYENTPYTPTIDITYSQLGDDIDYKACNYNENNYTFMQAPTVSKTISGSTYPIRLYMKNTTLSMSSISGQINYTNPETGSNDEGTSKDDNIIIMLAYKLDEKYIQFSEPSAKVRTNSIGDGANNSQIKHGLFSNLAEGITWQNETYEGKYDIKPVYIIVDKDNDEKISTGDFVYERTIRSDELNQNVGILSKITLKVAEGNF
ncbi:MAG TPA: hypothetical protein VFC68_00310 [Treponemataceae bacterium]|nr:hypothetical protein [Treponemataceae bacterium]